jgi:hypothetical protein
MFFLCLINYNLNYQWFSWNQLLSLTEGPQCLHFHLLLAQYSDRCQVNQVCKYEMFVPRTERLHNVCGSREGKVRELLDLD